MLAVVITSLVVEQHCVSVEVMHSHKYRVYNLF